MRGDTELTGLLAEQHAASDNRLSSAIELPCNMLPVLSHSNSQHREGLRQKLPRVLASLRTHARASLHMHTHLTGWAGTPTRWLYTRQCCNGCQWRSMLCLCSIINSGGCALQQPCGALTAGSGLPHGFKYGSALFSAMYKSYLRLVYTGTGAPCSYKLHHWLITARSARVSDTIGRGTLTFDESDKPVQEYLASSQVQHSAAQQVTLLAQRQQQRPVQRRRGTISRVSSSSAHAN